MWFPLALVASLWGWSCNAPAHDAIEPIGAPAGFAVVPAHCYASAGEACRAAGCPDHCSVRGGTETSPVLACGGTGVPVLTTDAREGIRCIRFVDHLAYATRELACQAAACPATVHDYCGDDGDRLVACRNGGW